MHGKLFVLSSLVVGVWLLGLLVGVYSCFGLAVEVGVFFCFFFGEFVGGEE